MWDLDRGSGDAPDQLVGCGLGVGAVGVVLEPFGAAVTCTNTGSHI